MTLTPENFLKEYKKVHQGYRPSERAIRLAQWINNSVVKHPTLSSIDPKFDVEGKKVIMMPSPSLRSGIDTIIKDVFEIQKAKFTGSLNDADIAVYVGNYLCDYGEDGSPMIMPVLHRVQNRGLLAVVITEGRLYSDYCVGKCPEYKFMYNLISEAIKQGGIHHSRIIDIPIGYPYNRIPFMMGD
jgi:hypothetical protein